MIERNTDQKKIINRISQFDQNGKRKIPLMTLSLNLRKFQKQKNQISININRDDITVNASLVAKYVDELIDRVILQLNENI